jgi:small subunit ribosomal protein S14
VKKYAALRAELKAKATTPAGQAAAQRQPGARGEPLQHDRPAPRLPAQVRCSRLTFREMALSGLIPGVTKASW